MIRLIYEMPYISYEADKVFDLEFEKLKPDEILPFIKGILEGNKFIDKYGDEIELKNNKEKENFVLHLKENMVFNNMINTKLNQKELEELNLLLNKE